jgi:plasmid stability protein
VTDIVLRDIDAVLADRIRRIADAHGWSLADALMRLLEQGLHACEGELGARLDQEERDVLQAAILALEHEPDDPGFARIGRNPAVPAAVPEEPDQSISPQFTLE